MIWTGHNWTLHQGNVLDALPTLESGSVNCVVTSPPYFALRDYGVDGQIGLERTPDEYVAKMVTVFREVRRVLRNDGVLFCNIGDSYAASGRGVGGGSIQNNAMGGPISEKNGFRSPPKGYKQKDLIGVPWMLAFALRADGWYLRQEIIWAKPNGMPHPVEDRTTSSHESIFLLSKKAHYWSDFDAIKTPPRESSMVRVAQNVQGQAGSHRANAGGKTNGTMKAVGVLEPRVDKQRGHSRRHAGFNDRWDSMSKDEQQSRPASMRDVWFVAPAQTKDSHFAVMPREIARRCILAGCPEGGLVLDPFAGSGTTLQVAVELGCRAVGIELNPDYCQLVKKRMAKAQPPLPFTEANPCSSPT